MVFKPTKGAYFCVHHDDRCLLVVQCANSLDSPSHLLPSILLPGSDLVFSKTSWSWLHTVTILDPVVCVKMNQISTSPWGCHTWRASKEDKGPSKWLGARWLGGERDWERECVHKYLTGGQNGVWISTKVNASFVNFHSWWKLQISHLWNEGNHSCPAWVVVKIKDCKLLREVVG